jgi:hypothetical protein
MKRFILSFATVLSLSLGTWVSSNSSAYASVDIAVSPPYLEFEIGKLSRTQSFKLVNFSKKAVKVRVSVNHWMLDEQNKVKILPPTEQSLDQWLIINPLEFTIPAQGEQTVRLGVSPRVQPELGEHRAMVYFSSEPEEAPVQGGVMVKGRLGAAVYGYVGDLKRVGTLHGVSVNATSKKATAVFDITSSGRNNIRMKGQYAIWPAAQYPGAAATQLIPNLDDFLNPADKPPEKSEKSKKSEAMLPKGLLEAGLLPLLPVLPQTRRQLSLQFQKPLPPGQYVLDLNGTLGETPIDKGIPFEVKP